MTDPSGRLTPYEDGILRRLFFFEKTGATLAPTMRRLVIDLRARDQRSAVRDPETVVVRVPHYT